MHKYFTTQGLRPRLLLAFAAAAAVTKVWENISSGRAFSLNAATAADAEAMTVRTSPSLFTHCMNSFPPPSVQHHHSYIITTICMHQRHKNHRLGINNLVVHKFLNNKTPHSPLKNWAERRKRKTLPQKVLRWRIWQCCKFALVILLMKLITRKSASLLSLNLWILLWSYQYFLVLLCVPMPLSLVNSVGNDTATKDCLQETSDYRVWREWCSFHSSHSTT